MSNLTKTAYYTRKGISLGIVGLISFFVLKALLGVGINLWKSAHPAPTPAPNVLFGKLPKLKFPQSKYSYPKDFTLETVGGELPQASSSAKVYQIPKKLPSLLASRHAQEFAARLGFIGEPVSKTATTYTYESAENPLKTLTLDILAHNFSLKYDFLKDRDLFTEKEIPSPPEAEIEADRFLGSTGNFPSDLKKGEKKVSFLRFTGQELLPTTSLSKAQAVRVDFLRGGVNDYPLLPPEFEKSSVFIIFSGSKRNEKRVLEVNFDYFEVDYGTSGTYPIKNPEEAWEDLKTGKGFIAHWQEKDGRATIRKVYLAYYDPPQYQPFLEPMFVFEGDKDFVAYAPAIKDEWME